VIRQDRFLVSILAGIALLVLLALLLFFIRRGPPSYGPDDSPLGVVQNYAVALSLKDYERAFSYVAGPPGVQVDAAANTTPGLPDRDHFRQFFLVEVNSQLPNTGLQIGELQSQIDENAVVSVTVLRTSGGLFDSVGREPQLVQLTRQNGAWKIFSAPYPFWNYAWAAPFFRGKTVPAVPAPAVS
jgi:hypothetical protein